MVVRTDRANGTAKACHRLRPNEVSTREETHAQGLSAATFSRSDGFDVSPSVKPSLRRASPPAAHGEESETDAAPGSRVSPIDCGHLLQTRCRRSGRST